MVVPPPSVLQRYMSSIVPPQSLWQQLRISVTGLRLSALTRTRKLMSHRLEVPNILAELFPLPGIGKCIIESSLGETNHLSSDTDPAFIQNLDSDLASQIDSPRVSKLTL